MCSEDKIKHKIIKILNSEKEIAINTLGAYNGIMPYESIIYKEIIKTLDICKATILTLHLENESHDRNIDILTKYLKLLDNIKDIYSIRKGYILSNIYSEKIKKIDEITFRIKNIEI